MKIRIAVFTLMILSLTAWGLKFDFESEKQLKDWEVVTGEWSIKEGALVIKNVEPHPGWDHGAGLIYGDPKWKDYVLKVKMKVIEALAGPGKPAGLAAPGPIVRYQDDNNWYYIECFLNRVIFRPHVGGVDRGWVKTAPVPEAPFPDKKDKWWELRVEVKGDEISVDVDGERVLEITYPDIKNGRIGLTAWPGDTVAYDDLELEGEGIPEFISVDPKEKLAVSWGEIKRRW